MRCPNCGFQLSVKKKTKWRRPKAAWRKGHEYLEGLLAKTQRRLEIFRNAGGEASWFDETDPSTVEEIRPANCQGCVEPHLVGWLDGEWHHNVKSHGGKRCDCAKCGLFVCMSWHQAFHNRVIAVRQIE